MFDLWLLLLLHVEVLEFPPIADWLLAQPDYGHMMLSLHYNDLVVKYVPAALQSNNNPLQPPANFD
jgi:hypothetical protein